jgi:hypothetical protein
VASGAQDEGKKQKNRRGKKEGETAAVGRIPHEHLLLIATMEAFDSGHTHN